MRLRWVLAVALVWGCGDDDDDDDVVVDAGYVQDRTGPPVDGFPGPDAQTNPFDDIGDVRLVDEGYEFLEGPTWRAADGVLLFSDIPADTIYQLTPPAAIEVFRMPSGNANGLDSDADGLLLAAEHGNRRVSRTEVGGTVVDVATSYLGDRLNSPNDIAVHSDGTIYFTDPPYGIDPGDQELSFNGVFRVPSDGGLVAEWEGALSARPNGIALSPDEGTLYVADTAAGSVRAYALVGGALTNERVFTDATPNADGMAVDTVGNLYVTTAEGINVFAPDGTLWGTIVVPRVPANCAFGGADARTLYITAREGLYSVVMPIRGIP